MTIFALEQCVENGVDLNISDAESALAELNTLRAQLAEAKADNERLLAANLDCIDHFEAMRDDLAEAQRELIAKESELDGLRASRIAYASEFPLNADGEPDVGNIHANIRSLKARLAKAQKDEERLDWMIEQCAYVVSDPDCCDGYWLNYPHKDGTLWVQTTEHETPRAAIDAAKGENNEPV